MNLFGRHNKEGQVKGTKAGNVSRDPVCGMNVETDHAAGESVYQGTTYYFCAAACKKAFDQNPAMYLQDKASTGEHTGHGRSGGHGCCG